jgi:hypothetical protein
MFTVEDPTVTVKCGTAIKVLFLSFNLCQSLQLDSLPCSFTWSSISFPTIFGDFLRNIVESRRHIYNTGCFIDMIIKVGLVLVWFYGV